MGEGGGVRAAAGGSEGSGGVRLAQPGTGAAKPEWVDFRAVKAAVNMEEVLRLYGVDRLRRSRASQLQGRCPIHRGSREDAFHVSLSKNVFQCFACQAHGNVLDLVAAMEGCCVREAAIRLAHRFGVSGHGRAPVGEMRQVRQRERENWLGKNKGGVENLQPPLGFVLRGIDDSHPYLSGRGISAETAVSFGVGFYAGPGMMSGRVVIPIHEARGVLVAYAGRSIHGELPKYRLPGGFQKSQVLFNFHRASAGQCETVVVVEGYFDCLKVHQAGVRNVVGLMGTVLSETCERLLVERFRQVVLMLDGDDAGQMGSQRIGSRLKGKCLVETVTVPAHAQADQLNGEEIRGLLGERVFSGERKP